MALLKIVCLRCLGQFSVRGVKPAHHRLCHLPKVFESPRTGYWGEEQNTQSCRAVLQLVLDVIWNKCFQVHNEVFCKSFARGSVFWMPWKACRPGLQKHQEQHSTQKVPFASSQPREGRKELLMLLMEPLFSLPTPSATVLFFFHI